jgi:hypothetical protein
MIASVQPSMDASRPAALLLRRRHRCAAYSSLSSLALSCD